MNTTKRNEIRDRICAALGNWHAVVQVDEASLATMGAIGSGLLALTLIAQPHCMSDCRRNRRPPGSRSEESKSSRELYFDSFGRVSHAFLRNHPFGFLDRIFVLSVERECPCQCFF